MTTHTHTHSASYALAAIVTAGACFLLTMQSAAAQQLFERPSDDTRPSQFRSLQQNSGDARIDADTELRTREAAREEAGETRLPVRGTQTGDAFRDRAAEMSAQIRAQRAEHQAELKAQLDAATTEQERQNILEEARGARDELRTHALEATAAFRARAQAVRAELRDHRAELRANIQTEAARGMKNHFENILARMSGALDHFSKLLERINTKVVELDTENADTTAVERAVAQAETSLEVSTAALADARSEFTAALEAENPRAHLGAVRSTTAEAVSAVKDTHMQLRDALRELHELVRSIELDVEAAADTSAAVDGNVDDE